MYACVYVLPFLCDFACVLCFQHICLSEQLYFQNTELKCITWKNNHLSALSISLCKFCKRNILTKLLPLLNCRRLSLTVCCWSLLVRTDVCTADFGITLVTFSPREKPGIVILNLSRPLLHRYEPFWLSTLALLQQWAIWKSCFYTWVSTSINSNIITPSLFSCPIILYALLSVFFGNLILRMWCECHEFSPLGFLAWPSSFSVSYIKLSALAVHHPGCLPSLAHLSVSLFLC